MHVFMLHKNKHFSDSAAFVLVFALVFYLVLFKALFNTLFIMTSHTHIYAHIKINATNNVELYVNLQSILIIICEFCSKNTTEAYKSKQKKFKINKLAC